MVDDHVEIETADAILILRVIGHSDRCRDSDAFKRWLEKQRNALGGWVLRQDFDGNRLAVAINELLVTHLKPRFLQKPRALPQIGAHRLRIAADRIDIGLREDFGRHLVAYRLENLQFAPFR